MNRRCPCGKCFDIFVRLCLNNVCFFFPIYFFCFFVIILLLTRTDGKEQTDIDERTGQTFVFVQVPIFFIFFVVFYLTRLKFTLRKKKQILHRLNYVAVLVRTYRPFSSKKKNNNAYRFNSSVVHFTPSPKCKITDRILMFHIFHLSWNYTYLLL